MNTIQYLMLATHFSLPNLFPDFHFPLTTLDFPNFSRCSMFPGDWSPWVHPAVPLGTSTSSTIII